ncbi:MAG: hypothetical protein J6Z08_09375 [Elusimicrobiales bacterium]|nr:hypothetical protein [Elusimicrobiales bacterium]
MNFNNFNNQHAPNSALEVSRMSDEQEAKQKQIMEENKAKQVLDEKRYKESLALTEKNVKLMEENNKICCQSLQKSIIANRIAYFSAFIALFSLGVAIYALVTK